MRVLVACEFSGIVRDAFIRVGHDAFSCDLLPAEDLHPERPVPDAHFQCDVRLILDRQWDLLIAHPPCTYLCNSGVRWLYKGGRIHGNSGNSRPALQEPERWLLMEQGAEFFSLLLNAPVPRICVENPIMHAHAHNRIDEPADVQVQTVQPWWFGHAETKATQLWLRGLPPLQATRVIRPDFEKYPPGKGNGFSPKVHHASPGPDRWKERSRTLPGLAEAMATQWGNL